MIKKYLAFVAVFGVLLFTGVAHAQSQTTVLKAPSGKSEFPACCEYCPSGGCTGCNAGPEGLNCGPGLIKAECTMKDDVTTCKKADSTNQSSSRKLKLRQ